MLNNVVDYIGGVRLVYGLNITYGDLARVVLGIKLVESWIHGLGDSDFVVMIVFRFLRDGRRSV